MKNRPLKIDRATLIKGGGTAALATLLAGALESRAEACCFPIDLSYGDVGSLERTSDKPSHRRAGTTGFTAVKIWAPKPNANPPPPLPGAPWTLLFTADMAAVKGNDENQNDHGNRSKPKPLGGKIWVFVK